MSTNKIDEMTELEAKALLNDICGKFNIGGKARTHSVVMTNINNALRRSRCLSRIESLHTETHTDEYGEVTEESLLNWGQEPETPTDSDVTVSESFQEHKNLVLNT